MAEALPSPSSSSLHPLAAAAGGGSPPSSSSDFILLVSGGGKDGGAGVAAQRDAGRPARRGGAGVLVAVAGSEAPPLPGTTTSATCSSSVTRTTLHRPGAAPPSRSPPPWPPRGKSRRRRRYRRRPPLFPPALALTVAEAAPLSFLLTDCVVRPTTGGLPSSLRSRSVRLIAWPRPRILESPCSCSSWVAPVPLCSSIYKFLLGSSWTWDGAAVSVCRFHCGASVLTLLLADVLQLLSVLLLLQGLFV